MISEQFSSKAIELSVKDILRNIRSHKDSFLVVNATTENISLPIEIIDMAPDLPLHPSVVGLEIDTEKLKTDCVLLTDEDYDSNRVGETRLEVDSMETVISTVIPEGKSEEDILKLVDSYTKGLDCAVKNDFHSITIIPFGREYDLDDQLCFMLAYTTVNKWLDNNEKELIDIYFNCDPDEFPIFEKLDADE